MSDNEHYEYARAAFAAANANAEVGFNAEVRADAQIQAALALAHEQRTANLIAIWQTGDINTGGAVVGITIEKRMEIYYEIAGRLGFKE